VVPPLTSICQTTDAQIEANAANKTALADWFETLRLLVELLYDLSSHDIPPILDEHLPNICELLHKYLIYANPLLDTDDDSETSVVDKVKADICEVLELYTMKYDDDFSQYCAPFITDAWNLLSSVGPESKHDVLVSKALHFLTAVGGTRQHSAMFNNDGTLSQIVEKVILPNVTLRETDIELFEDEPIEFIRRDLEGSDTYSRRRSATDFLRKLQEQFEALVTAVVSRYINHYLEQGKTDWKAKDTAIYLCMSIAAKGAVTAAQGVKTVNSQVNVVDFFQRHVAADLMASQVAHPIAKVDAIKYLYTFRSQLSKAQWKDAFPHLVRNIASDNYVIYTYAAIAVERLLALTDDSGVQMFERSDVEDSASDLLTKLFELIERDKTPAKLQENEFLMRCVMRIIVVIKDGASAVLEGVLTHLMAITGVIKQNPSNPRFYYYHFEALGGLVRYCSATKAALLNEKLWGPVQQIFTDDVTGKFTKDSAYGRGRI
jgi:exportin-2 (importin alpha re-exporter)